jgi:hypothetical protein
MPALLFRLKPEATGDQFTGSEARSPKDLREKDEHRDGGSV